jgi:glycosyltransferase involved in cell wall biosynthesis
LAVIRGADVYVRPTLADGDSVSVREAVALGRTVVATSVGTRPSEAILVPPGEADALATALVEAAEARPILRVARNTDEEVNDDCVRRLLELYGFDARPDAAASPAIARARTTREEPRCAASAAS